MHWRRKWQPTPVFLPGESQGLHWKDWCWSWNSNTLATWLEELTYWQRPSCWERLKVGREGDDRGWDVWMASVTQWTWVWVKSKSWWWTGRPGVLQSMGSQIVRHDWATELTDWTDLMIVLISCFLGLWLRNTTNWGTYRTEIYCLKFWWPQVWGQGVSGLVTSEDCEERSCTKPLSFEHRWMVTFCLHHFTSSSLHACLSLGPNFPILKDSIQEPPVVLWLGFCAFTAKGLGSIPG